MKLSGCWKASFFSRCNHCFVRRGPTTSCCFYFFLFGEWKTPKSEWILIELSFAYCRWQLLFEGTSRDDIVSKISLIFCRHAMPPQLCTFAIVIWCRRLPSSTFCWHVFFFYSFNYTKAFLYHGNCSPFDRIRYCVGWCLLLIHEIELKANSVCVFESSSVEIKEEKIEAKPHQKLISRLSDFVEGRLVA